MRSSGAPRRPLGLFGSAIALAGCGVHVTLSAPSRHAPIAERIEAYDRLRPVGYRQTRVMQGFVEQSRSTDFLMLHGGSRVEYPEDLLPIVPPNSPVAEWARRSRSSRGWVYGLRVAGIGLELGGGALMLGAIASLDSGGSASASGTGSSRFQIPPTFWIGTGAMLVGALIYVFAGIPAGNAADSAESAYQLYDSGLRERLGLCASGDGIGDCDPPAPRPPLGPSIGL